MINIIYYEWRLTLTVVKDSVQNHFWVQNHMTAKATFKTRSQVSIEKLFSTKPFQRTNRYCSLLIQQRAVRGYSGHFDGKCPPSLKIGDGRIMSWTKNSGSKEAVLIKTAECFLKCYISPVQHDTNDFIKTALRRLRIYNHFIFN